MGHGHDGLLRSFVGPVPQVGFPTRFLDQVLDAAFLDQFLVPVEGVSRKAHDLARLRDISELLGQVQQAEFIPDDLVVRMYCELSFWSRAPV